MFLIYEALIIFRPQSTQKHWKLSLTDIFLITDAPNTGSYSA
jgi:hypothetical protein